MRNMMLALGSAGVPIRRFAAARASSVDVIASCRFDDGLVARPKGRERMNRLSAQVGRYRTFIR
jgi:hypothetical protein